MRLTWTSPPLFGFHASRKALMERFGEPHERDLDSHGWGPFDAWHLRFDCGLELGLSQFQITPTGEPISSEEADRPVEVYANAREREHLAFHVGIERSAIEPWSPDPTHVADRRWISSAKTTHTRLRRARRRAMPPERRGDPRAAAH